MAEKLGAALQGNHEQKPGEMLSLAVKLLACPYCHHSPLTADQSRLLCSRCSWSGRIIEDVLLTQDAGQVTYFDGLHIKMTENNQVDSIWELFYADQVRTIEEQLARGGLAIDIGCGPAVPYRKPASGALIGVDPSYDSIRRNRGVDIGIHGTATALPVGNREADLVICLYSIHHMIGNTVAETRKYVRAAFAEFARVLRPGGRLMVFEVSPWPFFGLAERMAWNTTKRLLDKKIDFFFWSARELRTMVGDLLPNANFTRRQYHTSWTAVFPPAFALQQLRLPRFLYPFTVNLYSWQI